MQPKRHMDIRSLYIAVYKSCQLRFGYRTNFRGLYFTILEQHQGWYAPDAIAWWRGRIIVNIQLGDFNLSQVLPGDFLENRRDHFAWATPLRPIIDQYRDIRFDDFLFKGVIRQLKDIVSH